MYTFEKEPRREQYLSWFFFNEILLFPNEDACTKYIGSSDSKGKELAVTVAAHYVQ